MNTSVSCKCLTPSNIKRRNLLSHILIFEKSFVLLHVFLRVFGATHFMLFPFIFIYGSHQNPTSYSLLSKLLIFLPACAALLVVLLSWTCWARGLYSHVLCTSLVYTPRAPSLRCNRKYKFLRAHLCARTISYISLSQLSLKVTYVRTERNF